MYHTPTKTPLKVTSRLQLTPSTKNKICNICGKRFENCNDRRLLFKDGKLTNAGILLCAVIGLDADSMSSKTKMICRYCQGRLDTVKSKKETLIQQYKNTQSDLSAKFTTDIVKRAQPGAVRSPELLKKPPKRRSLLQSFHELDSSSNENQVPKSTEISNGSAASNYGENEIWVRVPFPQSGVRNIRVPEPFTSIVRSCTSGSLQHIAKTILENKDLKTHLHEQIMKKITAELTNICSITYDSVLRKTGKDDLCKFSWNVFLHELQIEAPIFLMFLEASVQNPSITRNKCKTPRTIIPSMLSAAATLVSIFNRDMSAIKKLKSIILKKGGLKKSAFSRLAAIDDCMSYQATINMLDSYGEEYDCDLLAWKDAVECGEDQQFVIASDNVDWEISPRQMTKTVRSKSVHKTHALAVKCRVPSLHLCNLKPLKNIQDISLQEFLPSTDDNAKLEDHLVHLISQIWAQLLPQFHSFQDSIPNFIIHRYQAFMKQKSVPVFLGCYDIDQKVTDEVQTMLQDFHQKYVPNHSDDANIRPQKVIAFADYLGFERQKAAQCQVRDARSPSQRLEGFVSGLSDFHAQAVWHNITWHHLYNTLSGNEIGTLYHARQTLGARNVTMDPHSNFYASEELLDKFTKGYVLAGAFHHFGMESLQDNMTQNMYEGLDNEDSKRAFIMAQARSFVRNHVLNPPPTLTPPQLKCKYCNKLYKKKAALRNHESSHRQQLQTHDGTGFQCLICGKVYTRERNLDSHLAQHSDHLDTPEDKIYHYTRTAMMLCCLRLNMEDAIKMGDGERLILCYKYMYLYCKQSGHDKYALGLLETVAQSTMLLSERDAENLQWNRFINTQGKVNTNFPIDLFVEHQNHPLKRDVTTFRGEITNKTLQRISRSLNDSQKILAQFDKSNKVFHSAGTHKEVDKVPDIVQFAETLHKNGKVFEEIPGRFHKEFRTITPNPLHQLDVIDLQKWLKKTVHGSNGFAKKHYYKYPEQAM